MNIFILDENPDVAAKLHNDRHVVKMIVETAQLLSTAHHVAESPIAPLLYRKTHTNHPCAKWVRESKANYEWAYRLFVELCHEYTHRYGKTHKTFAEKAIALGNVPELPNVGLTPFPQCMPDECKVEGDAVSAYRKYYQVAKAHIATWKNRETPKWFNSDRSRTSQVS